MKRWQFILAGVIVIAVAMYLFFQSRSGSVGVRDELNSDGIRPDVAIAITKMFSHSEKARAVATQLARATQQAIEQPENALEIYAKDRAATACYYALAKDESRMSPSLNSAADSASFQDSLAGVDAVPIVIEGLVVNSNERTRAYIRYNKGLSGRVFDGIMPDHTACEFDLTSMSN